MAADAIRLQARTGARASTRRQATGWIGTLALIAGLVACALLVWPGFLRGGTAYVIVSGNSMEPTLQAGDVVLTVRRRSYDVGDVVAYRIPRGGPGAGVLIIHRIVGGSASTGYVMQGDNRAGRDAWRPRPQSIAGEAAVTLPHVGVALAWLRTPLGLATLAALVTLLVVFASSRAGGGAGAGEGRAPTTARRAHAWGEAAWTARDLTPEPDEIGALPPLPPRPILGASHCYESRDARVVQR